MKFITPKFNFMRHHRGYMLGSLLLSSLMVGALFLSPLNYSIDYTGGFLVEIQLERSDGDPEELKTMISETGLAIANVQRYGNVQEMLLRLPPQENLSTKNIEARLYEPLERFDPGHQIVRGDFVGPSVGGEQREQGVKAVLMTMLLILIYISFRFEKRFALGAIVATAHDCILIMGFFALSGLEFGLAEFAAVLAVVGYSLNDTIVIYDRVRDNLRSDTEQCTLQQLIDRSINQTLARTLVTGGTTLLALFALFFFGGQILHNFSITLIFGVIVGTYSSIYIASALLMALGLKAQDIRLEDPESTASTES